MKRKIITIDEKLCNGCGQCVTACAEGALKIVNGKARLVREQFCDGFGDCMGECPTGALKIEERESVAYDEKATLSHVRAEGGEEAVRRMQVAGARHQLGPPPGPAASGHTHEGGGGCPGMRARFAPKRTAAAVPTGPAGGGSAIRSELEQWPVQLHLVQPGAEFFRNRELVLLSTCSPIACPDVHWRFIRGRGVAVACPKLDDTEGYAEKLGQILADPTIPKVTVVRMEVPCCGGLTQILRLGLQLSGRNDLKAEEVVVGLGGDILETRSLMG